MNVTISIDEKFYEDFKDLCHDRKVTFSSMFERLGTVELSKNIDNDRLSRPLLQDDKVVWVRWIKEQTDITLKEFITKIDYIYIYALAFSKVSNITRKDYGFLDYKQALEFAQRK